MLEPIINMCVSIMKWPLIIFFGTCAVFVADAFIFLMIEYKKGRRLNPGSVRKLPKRSALARIFIDAPRQYVDDMLNRPPDFFQPQGLIVFCGRQGMGKTSAMMQYTLDLQYMYPECKVISNTRFLYQDEALRHWRQLIDYKNAQKGVVVIMDELQNWFSSNQSKQFPPEMLSVITQNRKNRRLILGTSQNFYLLAKAIRSQATEIRQCVTLAGVLTIVIRREPILDNDGDVKEFKHRGMYFFVHSKRLRESYDTWATVENLSKSGFHDNPFLKDEGKVIEKSDKK